MVDLDHEDPNPYHYCLTKLIFKIYALCTAATKAGSIDYNAIYGS